MGQHRPNIGQHRANIHPTWAQDEPNIGPTWANIGPDGPDGSTWVEGLAWPNIKPRWAQDGSTWARLGPTWAQPALNIGPDCFHTGKHGFARGISAQSSHTISQKSLLGRRPAVRRKPLNPPSGNSTNIPEGTLIFLREAQAIAGSRPFSTVSSCASSLRTKGVVEEQN